VSIASADTRTANSSEEAQTNEITFVDDEAPVKRRRKRKSTSHLKEVPDTLEVREKVKAACEEFAKTLDRSRNFNKAELEDWARCPKSTLASWRS